MAKITRFIFICVLSLWARNSHGLTLELNSQFVMPVFTPFNENGDINPSMIRKMAQKCANDNITSILVGSYGGEGPSMDLRTRKSLVSAWVKAGVPLGLQIMVEIGAIAFTDKLKLAEFCTGLEVTAIFVYPEISYKAKTVNEVIEDLKAVAEVAPEIPMIIHEWVFLTNSFVNSLEVFKEASSNIPTFAGMTMDLTSANELQILVGSTNDKLIIVSGNNVDPALALQTGLCFSLWLNLFPELMINIATAVNECDYEKTADLQSEFNDRIVAVSQLEGEFVIDYFSRTFIQHLKFAYRLITGWDLKQRRPLVEVDQAEADKIRSSLTELGVKLAS